MIHFLAENGPRLENTGLSCTILRKYEELEALAPAWQELLDKSSHPEPFLTPAWLLTWWQVYGPSSGRCLQFGLFHDSNKLIGIAPLCRRRYWHRPGIPFRRLEPLGADAEEEDGVCSDYLNLIMERGKEEKVIAAFVQELVHGSFGSWDELVLPAMNGAELTPQLLSLKLQQAGLQAEMTTQDQAVYLTLPGSWEEYLQGFKSKQRYAVQSWQKKFLQWADGNFKLERVATPDDLDKGQKILKSLHQERWRAEGKPGLFSFPRFERFHDLYLPRALAEGKLELLWLTVGDESVAVIYNLRAGGKVYFYQCGRKMDLPGSIRLGKVQVIYAIQEAIRQGAREFDFLAGAMGYKLEFTQTTRPLVQVRAVRGRFREMLRAWGEKGMTLARKIRNRWRDSHQKPSLQDPSGE